MTSDHGHLDAPKHFLIEEFLRRTAGLNIARKHLWESTRFQKRLDDYREFSCVLYGSGDRYWAISLRKPIRKGGRVVDFQPWTVRPDAEDLKAYPAMDPREARRAGSRLRPAAGLAHRASVDLLDLLIRQEAVDTVAYRVGANRVRVRTKTGEAEFGQPDGRGGEIGYQLTSGNDPFGWNASLPSGVQGGRRIPQRRWLELTASTEYPDLPAQILAYFRSPKAGDIAVFAAPGWDFDDKHHSGHGGNRPADMHVPLLLAGPGVSHGRVSHARTVDLMPTLLKLLGKEIPPDLDGRPLPIFRTPVPPTARPARADLAAPTHPARQAQSSAR